ncbi:MAG: S-layer homology domain-containing protein [Candidatus Peribacteria bacterium]|jgi:hypothetical protein|nr:S-layer homology domain-containing protein [Candidatus Peribacteria bacterium]
MYQNGLTMYATATDYRPSDLLTREESAKIIGQLFEVLGFEKKEKNVNCAFVDAKSFDPTLALHIQKVCKRGIFRGNDKTSEYMPHNQLTKGEILAVLIRILEGKLSNETDSPRWIEYYVKSRILQLTQETNLLSIDTSITRYEVALLIYRFKNLIVGTNGESRLLEILRTIYVAVDERPDEYLKMIDDILREWRKAVGESSIGNHTNSSTTGSGNTSGTTSGSTSGENEIDLNLIVGDFSLVDDPEFNEAINRMYDAQITNYNTPDAYMPFQKITREQVAKMLDKFATATTLTTIRNPSPCSFSDVSSGSAFFTAISNVCKYGAMKGANGKFSPTEIVSKAEFIAILIRLFEGKSLDESLNPRWTEYYKKAIELSLISAQDTVSFPNAISRYEVALFLYRMKVRRTMFSNLNGTALTDEVVRTLENTTLSGEEKKSGKIAVDLVSLNNRDFTNGYIELFGQRYILKKSTLTTYNVGTNSFVWYGDLVDLETDKYIGTTTFIITNANLTEGIIRFSSLKTSYYISKDPLTTAYYHIKQV